VCAPVYGEVLGLTTEVLLGPEQGLPRTSAARCDFLTLMFKRKLTDFVGTLSGAKLPELNRALTTALELPLSH
jgi:mRNA interferase MazF